MAMDIRITSGYRIEMGYLFPKQLLAIFQILIVLTQSFASPVWMPQFLSAGQGRNIRHLPCISRRTGEQGICMFAYTCMKSNGTHLGTCIDRFYFGSCCRIEDNNDLILDNHLNFPVINNNQVSSPFYPDDGKIETIQTTSVQNNFNQFTGSHTSTNINYPIKTSTAKIDTSTLPSVSVFDNGAHYTSSVMTLAQHLATGMDANTEKVYVPVFTSVKPNKTDGDLKKPPNNQIPVVTTAVPPTTTLQYFLSTFQVVHSEGDTTTLAPTTQTTKRITTSTTAKSTTVTKPTTTTILTTQHKKNQTITTKPTSPTTTKKPSKPNKPYTTTRKPPTKKPPTKPPVKTTTSKPVQKVTTAKPAVPTKKPIPPTKKPVPTTQKPTTTTKPTTKPTKITTTKKPTTTTTKQPAYSTLYPLETTSEVIFTKPGSTATFSTPTTLFGITTFRPDLTPTTGKPILITGPGLTTFSYVSEGIKDTTLKPETTTSKFQTTTSKPFTPTTISNEISSSSELIGAISGGGIPEAQEENTNVIFQQAGSTDFSSPPSSVGTTLVNTTITDTSSVKPANATVPFFPETTQPEPTKTPWIEIVQGSSTSETTTINETTVSTIPTTDIPMFTGLNASDYTQVCGRRIFPEARVVGGEKSTFGKWPWQISLRQWRTSTYLHKCGAALLNENWAITAAHCVENVPPSDLLLRLGEHDLSTENEPYGFQERRVQIVASHPQFDPRTFEYDLALLRFYEPVKFQPNIIPVCVPEDNTNFVGQTAYVTGWGRLYEDGPLPSVLQEVSVPVINNTLCENMYRAAGYIEHIPEIFICAGWKKGGFDSCEGDSGGPMVIQRPDKRWLLAGVISWGIGCAEPNQPGVYTRISEFREWIHQILQF